MRGSKRPDVGLEQLFGVKEQELRAAEGYSCLQNSASLERALQKVFSVVVVLVLASAIAIVFLILIHAIVNSSARAEATETPAAEGAELGDDVALRYPGATVLCSSRKEADVWYLAGKVAFAQTMRVERSLWQALKEQSAARKQIMRDLSSCEWAPRNLRYRVDQKQTTATEVSYCLWPIVSDDSSCWWLIEEIRTYSPFKDVQRPTGKHQRNVPVEKNPDRAMGQAL